MSHNLGCTVFDFTHVEPPLSLTGITYVSPLPSTTWPNTFTRALAALPPENITTREDAEEIDGVVMTEGSQCCCGAAGSPRALFEKRDW